MTISVTRGQSFIPGGSPSSLVLFRRHVTAWVFTEGAALPGAAILFAQLGPSDWQLRTGLGWETEHIIAYFVVTSIAFLVWPRPFVVGAALMAASVLLEAAQNLTPDRHANFQAGLYGAGGALGAALLAELFTRVWRWRAPLKTVKVAGALAVVAFAVVSLVAWELRQHTGASEMGPPGPPGPPGPLRRSGSSQLAVIK